ncbi:MAG TPA: phosphoenolpyruvate--protein phosphotransferase [Bacteroidota bacterium]|nr:phosphoenolpyruvate--protein phosphotransferase [Candidatus Kapabacteria bacterium]HRS01619.1 phosphoenolpyruvate--protein phosphotransferase [Bacteroidota bacterium]
MDNLNDVLISDEKVLKGIPASTGIEIGEAFVIKPDIFIEENLTISSDNINNEIKKFLDAKDKYLEEISLALSKVPMESKELRGILATNQMLLEDPIFTNEIIKSIRNGLSAESAILLNFEKQKQFLRQSSDQVFRDRIIELDNIEKRLYFYLKQPEFSIKIKDNTILVVQSISTTDLINAHSQGLKAIITEFGGMTSHIAILARSFKMPAIISVNRATSIIQNGQKLIVDGYTGEIFIEPNEELIELYQEKIKTEKEYKESLSKFIEIPSFTRDHHKVGLWCNANNSEEVHQAFLNGAEGLGLVRTEHLVISLDRFPDEEEQFEYYNEIAQIAYPMKVTLRAFDIGTDKYSKHIAKREENPALGFRGIRFLLSQKDYFKSQLRAVLRASRNKNVRFMLPMISTVEEVIQTQALMNECKKELEKEGKTFDNNLELGIMIETPSAALLSDELARICSFFSIGTNDLTQYTLAVDRDNELLVDYFNPFTKSVLRLMSIIVNSAHKNNIPVAICGEMANHPAATHILVGLGIDELSVSPSVLLEVKQTILNLSYEESNRNIKNMLQLNNLL